MFNHKEGCKFKDYYFQMYAPDSYGPDHDICIMESGIEFDHNVHTKDEEDWILDFNFCPICGVNKE